MSDLPIVAVYGVTEPLQLLSQGPVPPHETQALDCRCYPTDADALRHLASDRPVAIVTFGREADYPVLLRLPFDFRRRWLHFPHGTDLAHVGASIFRCLLFDATTPRRAPPLVSVFTPAYRTGEKIDRPLRSLLAQTYPEWEWILLDDSDDDGETFRRLSTLAEQDPRIHVFKARRPSGVIGSLKRQAARLGRGDILVELDHDDELTSTALADVVQSFIAHPDAGFAWSDCAEVIEATGENAVYGKGWGFGYGETYPTTYAGRDLLPHRAPMPNSVTIRHIVSAPNHLRAWRRSVYDALGGHSPLFHVADDYELCVRTFLHTRMVRIESVGYIQYYNATGNTQRVRNKDIQRLVRAVKESYDRRIHERFLDLGVEDFAWNEGRGSADLGVPHRPDAPHAGLSFRPLR